MTLSGKRWRDDVCKTGFHFKEEDVKEFIKRIKARIILPRYRKIIDEEAGEDLI